MTKSLSKGLLIHTLWFVLIFMSASAGMAQQPGPGNNNVLIKGVVIDDDTQEKLEFAAISIFNASDSTLVTGGVTDIDGAFSLKVGPGTYNAKIEYISFEEQWINNIEIAPGSEFYDLETISIGMSSETLDEVVVTAEKSRFQMGLDKRVFNVDKDIVSRAGNAADILDNIPSVSVDFEGNVSLRGSDNVRILIDGRPSGLVGLSGSDALRALQGDLVERVEVITNPSARYEAEGMAGIINIVLKKDKRSGVNGSVNVYAGVPSNYGLSGSINARKNKFNFFANIGTRYRKSPGGGDLYQEYYNGDTTTYLEQTRDRERGGWSYNARLGMDYSFTPNTTLTGSFMYRDGDEENESTVWYRDYDWNYDLTSITKRRELETEVEPNYEYALNFRHLFDGDDKHELKAVAQYEDTKETEDADYLEQVFNPDGTPSEIPDLIQHRLSIEGQTQWLFQVDYTRPVLGNGMFEAGYRFNSRDISNDYTVEEYDGNEWIGIPGLSNNFLYTERIQAGYLIFGQDAGRFDYQAGLRAEHSDIDTRLIETGEENHKDYIDFFPSAHVGYDLGNQNSIQVSYSKRIRRPHFRMLNPFNSFSDSRNIWTGNPDLNPEYTQSAELGYLKYWDGASLSSSVYYRHTEDVIQRIRSINSEGITVTKPENLSSRDQWGFEFTFSADILPTWKLDGNANLFHETTTDSIFGDADSFSAMGRINSRVTLFGVVETQLRLNYRGPRNTTQGRSKAMYYADLGASMDILKKKATLSLSVNDIFNTRQYRYSTNGEGFSSDGSWRWRSSSATLTFTYRLNQNKNRKDKEGREDFDGGDMDFNG